MNEVKLSGKVLNAYINEQGYFTVTIATLHDHYVDDYNNSSESKFRAFLMNKEKSKHIDIIKGDRVMITAYLKQDITLSATGNERKRVNIYIKDIELIKPEASRSTMSFVNRFFK